MDLTRIFTIGGKPGLQKLVAQSKNGVILESLIDGKRFNASSNSKISSLEDISVFCTDGDKPLKEILDELGTTNKFKTIETPADSDLKTNLKTYLPNLDNERVYNSDVKKIYKWYNLLIEADLLKEEKKEEKAAADKDPSKKKTAVKKPAALKKAPVKRAPSTKTAGKKAGSVKSASAKKNG